MRERKIVGEVGDFALPVSDHPADGLNVFGLNVFGQDARAR